MIRWLTAKAGAVPQGRRENHVYALFRAGAVVGFIICMICFLFTKQGSLAQEWQAISWHYFLIGIMVPGVEVGFIAMYHSGWQVSKAALTADVLVTSLLVLIGMLVFGEHLSLINLAGVLCCFAGVIMLER